MEMENTDLDPEDLFRFAEQMVDVVEQRASSDASVFDELRANPCHIFVQEDHVELLTILEGLQKQVTAAENALQEDQIVDQSSLSATDLQTQKDDLLHQQRAMKMRERSLQDTQEHLSKLRPTLQSHRVLSKKLDAEMQRNQIILALCASTFHLIASDGGLDDVAGSLVDSKGCVVDTFAFKTENSDAFDVCEKLWSLCSAS